MPIPVPRPSLAHPAALPETVGAVVFDVDGVLEYRGRVLPGAIDLVAHLKQRHVPVRILTNSTLKSRRSCAARMRRQGFDVDTEEVITASYATARHLRALAPRSCWVMLEGDGLDEFAAFTQSRDDPEVVVVGDLRDRFTPANLNLALRHLVRGATLVVMITEQVDGSQGALELTVGAYGRMLESAAGVRATWIGKPHRPMFDLVMESLPGLTPGRVLMVGDKVSTDIAGARRAGMCTALVRTGEHKPSDLSGPVAPDVVLDAVADLLPVWTASERMTK